MGSGSVDVPGLRVPPCRCATRVGHPAPGSYRHYATGIDGVVEIELPLAAWRKRQMGAQPDAVPNLSAKNADKDGAPQLKD